MTLEELDLILKTKRQEEYHQRRFSAAIAGAELPDPTQEKIKEVRERAARKLAGGGDELDFNKMSFEDLGIEFISD